MRIAYQGEPGAFSEAAARRIVADAQLVAVPDLRGGVRVGRERAGRLRHRADRELDRRQHPSQLRPAGDAPAADRRGGRAAGRSSAARASGRDARAAAARLFASAGAGAVRAVSSHADRRRDRRHLRHGRQREDGGRRAARGRRRNRVGPRRRGVRPDGAGFVDSGLRRQHHALSRHRPPADQRHRARQDVDRVLRCRTSPARCSRR